MDEAIRQLIRQLPPHLQAIFNQILNGTLPIGPGLLIEIIRRAVESGVDRGLLIRLLTMLGRIGRLSPAVVSEASGIAVAETGAGAAATGGAATGGAATGGAATGGAATGGAATGGAATGGAATGGATTGTAAGASVAATVAAILIAVLAILLAIYSIYSEVTTELELPSDGPPCGLGTPEGREMATVKRTITRRAIGTRTSLNKAIAAAQENCMEDAAKCKGGCGDGKTCRPSVAIQEWTQYYRVFWTTTEITYVCPCACVDK